jgi:DNA-binding PadR family transcriptional regulator
MAGEKAANRRSPLAVVVLALLAEEPMHPYRMQRLIKERGKDQIANVAQRNSVYQTIDRLQRGGLITVHDTERDERRPERTVYALTDTGRATLMSWLRTMLATPSREFPEFPAALATLMLLPPAEVADLLAARADELAARLAESAPAADLPFELPRLFTLDDEYKAALTRAELTWLRSVLADLRAGRLTWSQEWIERIAAAAETQK